MAMKYKVGDLFFKQKQLRDGVFKVRIVSVTGTDIYYERVDPRTNLPYISKMANPVRLEHKDAERLLTPISKLERYLEGIDNEDAS